MSEKVNKTETQENAESSGIRVNSETKRKAHELLKAANQKARGRKIKMPDLIGLALELITEKEIQRLQRSSWTKHDEMEAWRSIYSKKNGQISRDEFLGFMMTAEWAGFMKEHKKDFEALQ